MVNPDGSVKINGGTGGGSVDVGGDGSVKIKGGLDGTKVEDNEDSITIDDKGILLEDAVDSVRITY